MHARWFLLREVVSIEYDAVVNNFTEDPVDGENDADTTHRRGSNEGCSLSEKTFDTVPDRQFIFFILSFLA